ncbi:uncharacterized protein B0P05DRAFT_543933 [Gilbertella persicaria]|uniref:Phosphatidate phosphatase APP1 catalytic domain-containing protein n=1 Tax=Rhizopus stolonifer TaxID=4846 RepID=A0A367JQA3_RHIST|nr:uncharacterized protein B0P05DRAFT_543933 [Gilbertella persicaria]KAI8078056.1 hypothetical protein B0P05DRAFT_543933 [Gilbertella persicaria]RCH92117.1 hypothetical protein CU098_004108 [Rhizopus stolonifer]
METMSRECLLFPTYAKRNPSDTSQWIVYVKGWALSHNSSATKQKMMMSLTKSVAGKFSTDTNASHMFEQRFKYFLANNKRHKPFHIQAIGTISLEAYQSEQQSQLEQAMMNLLMDSINSQLDSLEDPTSCSGIHLITEGSGFLSGQFFVPHDTILNWADNPRLVRVQSVSTDTHHKFMPNYGIVNLIEQKGVSIISDIDDTIKDTRILSGARTVLSKTFFEAPQDVSGMADVYMTWYTQGASFHYVSNSPFQLMPMLDKFLKDARFPPGSMHLRDDGKLISRLVETPGQAKRDAILKILHDFPQRRFILVGDSGEIDLEIYSRIAVEYPDQIIKIYIRDITTPSLMPTLFHSKSRSTPLMDIRKLKSPLSIRRATTEPTLTHHQKDMAALEASAQLHHRIKKARLQVSNIDIELFQDAQVLARLDIKEALWDSIEEVVTPSPEKDAFYSPSCLYDTSILSSSPTNLY